MKSKFKNIIKYLKKYVNLIDVIALFIISIGFTLSDDLINDRHISLSFNLFMKYIMFVFIFNIVFLIFRISLDRLSKSRKNNKLINKIMSSKKRIFILALIIFLCWLPSLIMLYPGTCINDTWGQLASVIRLKNGHWSMSAHHPIFDTFYMSSIILPIVYKTNNWHVAMFVYVIIQSIITSIVFAYSIIYAKNKLNVNDKVIILLLLIYIICPIYVTSVQTISKDALSAYIYVLFTIQFIEIVRTNGKYLLDKKNMFIHILTITFCILTKKIEAYVIILSYIPLLISYRKIFKFILFPLLSTVLIFFIILPTLRLTFSISKSGKQEMYSLPFQMTARYVKYNYKDIPEEEKIVISKVLNYDELKDTYNPTNADPVKKYNQKGEDLDYINYLKVWFKQGIKAPIIYLKAAGCQVIGWFSLTEYKPLINMDNHSQIHSGVIPERAAIRNNHSNKTYKIYNNIYDFVYEIPLLKLFLSYGFYATFLPAFIILTLIKNRKFNFLFCCVPLVSTIVIGCYLAPVSINPEGLRYLYPITYTIPILLIVILNSCKEKDYIK